GGPVWSHESQHHYGNHTALISSCSTKLALGFVNLMKARLEAGLQQEIAVQRDCTDRGDRSAEHYSVTCFGKFSERAIAAHLLVVEHEQLRVVGRVNVPREVPIDDVVFGAAVDKLCSFLDRYAAEAELSKLLHFVGGVLRGDLCFQLLQALLIGPAH